MAATTLHVQIDLKGMLARDNRDLRRWLGAFTFDGQQAATVSELRMRLLDLVAEGQLYLPIGTPCEGWSPATGCPGHVQEDEGLTVQAPPPDGGATC